MIKLFAQLLNHPVKIGAGQFWCHPV